MDDLSLAAEFPQPGREEWLALVAGVLKGADFDRKLVSKTYDGLAIQPLYAKAEGTAPLRRAEPGPWRVSQRVDHPEPTAANELALADLEGGADALTLVTRKAPAARGFGVRIDTLDDLDRALAGVEMDLIHWRLDAGGHGRQVAGLFTALAERRGHRLSAISADLGLDPIGAMAATGLLSASWEVVAGRLGETLADLAARGFKGRTALADGRPHHEAGAGEAQELAAILATALAYWRALEAHGHALDAGRDALAFLLVADADEFLTVAKLRALRKLWARIEQAAGLVPKPIRIHAETAWRMMTRRDPWVNMLRATIATFSAGIGGADAVTVLPFTAALGLPDAFARRIARNTQTILLHESNLWRVADPAAGAGGFEALTEALCEKAWSLLQDIERDGGMVESLRRGSWQARLAATRAQREKAVATRRDPITGTSEYPNLREADVAVLSPSPLWGGARGGGDGSEPSERSAHTPLSNSPPPQVGYSRLAHGEGDLGNTRDPWGREPVAPVAPTPLDPVHVDPLPAIRSAEPFERLRDRSDAALARTGERPKVFLATLGTPAEFTARATFAKNFFEAGGIESLSSEPSSSLRELAKAWLDSKAKLICLCSTDENYREQAIAASEALRRAGGGPIFLAGRPSELEESLKQAGVDRFIFVGCDALAVLGEALDAAGA